MRPLKTLSFFLQYQLVVLLMALISSLPLGFAARMARAMAGLAFILFTKRRRIALENLDRAFGNSLSQKGKQRIAKQSFEGMALSILELFCMEKMRALVHERFEIKGKEHLDRAFERGKGVILVISHLGSWEYLSFLPYLTNKSWSVIVKTIRNPFVDEKVNALRRVTTVNPIPKQNPMKPVIRELRENHGVAILIDQWAGGDGLWLNFFGHATSTTSVPARLALQRGCALVPAYCLRRKFGEYEIHLEPAFEFDLTGIEKSQAEVEMTKKLNDWLEAKVRKYPEQWTWAHRRWKPKPKFLRSTKRKDDAAAADRIMNSPGE